jgi:hypothetical protein
MDDISFFQPWMTRELGMVDCVEGCDVEYQVHQYPWSSGAARWELEYEMGSGWYGCLYAWFEHDL